LLCLALASLIVPGDTLWQEGSLYRCPAELMPGPDGRKLPLGKPPSSSSGSAATAVTSLAPAMSAEWFYRKGSQTLGPFSWDQLQQFAGAGLLLPADLVCEKGEQHWYLADCAKGPDGQKLLFSTNNDPELHYWLMIEKTPQGPFDIVTIQAKLSANEINSTTPVCQLGSQVWFPVARLLPSALDQAIQPPVTKNSPGQKMPPPMPIPQNEPAPSIATDGAIGQEVTFSSVCGCIIITIIGIGIGALVTYLLWPSGYNLSNRNLPKGTIIKEETKASLTAGTVTSVIAGQAVMGTVDVESDEVIQTEVLQVSGKDPSKFKISFLTDISTVTTTLPNQPAKVERVLGVFHGHTLLAEKVGGVWKRRLLSGDPPPAQAHALQAEWTSDDIYPDRRLKIGEIWTVNGPQLRKLTGMSDALSCQGSGTFTFQELVTRNNEKCALIHTQLEIKARGLDDQNREWITEMSLSGHIHRSLTSFTDVAEFSGTMKATGGIVVEGQLVRLMTSGPLTFRLAQTRK
jgi:hypothetical protein